MNNQFCCKMCGNNKFKIELNVITDDIISYNHIVVACDNCENHFVINADETILDDSGIGIEDVQKVWRLKNNG